MKFLFIFFAIIAACSAAVLSPDQSVPIVKQLKHVSPDGTYSYNYETANGIIAEEVGEGGHFAKGSIQWSSPEGVPVHITYVADENGYQPVGDVIPVVPPAIVRALEYIRAHPPKEEYKTTHKFKRQVGSDPCTYGPSYWCASQANAVKCNTIQYCTDNVW